MISIRSVLRAVSLYGVVPGRRTAFARENTVDDDGETVLGVFAGVVRGRFVGVNNDTVRFAETGVIGTARINLGLERGGSKCTCCLCVLFGCCRGYVFDVFFSPDRGCRSFPFNRHLLQKRIEYSDTSNSNTNILSSKIGKVKYEIRDDAKPSKRNE